MGRRGRMLSFCMNWGGKARRVAEGLRIANRRPGTGFVQMRSGEGALFNSHGRKAVDPRSNNQRRAPKVRHCNIFSLAIDTRIDSWQENT